MLTGGQIIVVGMLACLLMDLWQLFLWIAMRIPAPQWGLLGRWVAYMPRGRWWHQPIMATPAAAGETALGWLLHYAVGIAYAFAYAGLLAVLERPPSLLSALAFGVVTVLVPWFVMQPALGMGAMARRTPRPHQVRAVNLSVHGVFGVGLYLGSVLVG